MEYKNNKGATLIEFSLIAIVFFAITFSTVALGIDAYRRFVAGEESENVLKKVENTSSLFLDTPSFNLCRMAIIDETDIPDSENTEDNSQEENVSNKQFCGFEIEDAETCEEALERSVEQNCKYGDPICIFWFNLYKIAKTYEKSNQEEGGYLYGKVYGGGEKGGKECRSSFAILLPGFNTNKENKKNKGSIPNMAMRADNNGTALLQRIKNHEVAGVKKYVPSLFDKVLGKNKRGSEVYHLGYVRTGTGRIEGNVNPGINIQYITEQNPPSNSIYSKILSYRAPIVETINKTHVVTIKFFLSVILVFPKASSKNESLKPA